MTDMSPATTTIYKMYYITMAFGNWTNVNPCILVPLTTNLSAASTNLTLFSLRSSANNNGEKSIALVSRLILTSSVLPPYRLPSSLPYFNLSLGFSRLSLRSQRSLCFVSHLHSLYRLISSFACFCLSLASVSLSLPSLPHFHVSLSFLYRLNVTYRPTDLVLTSDHNIKRVVLFNSVLKKRWGLFLFWLF